jgi:hypothetical protein
MKQESRKARRYSKDDSRMERDRTLGMDASCDIDLTHGSLDCCRQSSATCLCPRVEGGTAPMQLKFDRQGAIFYSRYVGLSLPKASNFGEDFILVDTSEQSRCHTCHT